MKLFIARLELQSLLYVFISYLVLGLSPKKTVAHSSNFPIPLFVDASICIAIFGLTSGIQAQRHPGNWKWLSWVGALLNLYIIASLAVMLLLPYLFSSFIVAISYSTPIVFSVLASWFMYIKPLQKNM